MLALKDSAKEGHISVLLAFLCQGRSQDNEVVYGVETTYDDPQSPMVWLLSASDLSPSNPLIAYFSHHTDVLAGVQTSQAHHPRQALPPPETLTSPDSLRTHGPTSLGSVPKCHLNPSFLTYSIFITI